MPSVNELYGTFLKAEDLLDGTHKGRILQISAETVGGTGNHPVRPKLLIKVEGLDKKVVLNVTNAKYLARVLGDDYSKWPGRTVLVSAVDVQFQGEWVKGIKVEAVEEGGAK